MLPNTSIKQDLCGESERIENFFALPYLLSVGTATTAENAQSDTDCGPKIVHRQENT